MSITEALSDLNNEQRRAVIHPGNEMVFAVPGAGKTRVIDVRAYYLLNQYPDANLLAVTFTNKSAQELTTRISQRLGYKSKKLGIGTFHSLALNQLRRHNYVDNLLSDGQQNAFMNRVWKSIAPGMLFQDAKEAIEHYKSMLSPPPDDSTAYQLFLEYNRLLERNKCMDFADIIIRAVNLMKSGHIPPYQADYILVDEFQDTDHVQEAWLNLHGDADSKITVVGDDDQSVYGWRYAMGYEGMKRFIRRYNAETITLDTNYRSRQEILDSAASLIANNHHRVPKKLHAHSGTGGSVVVRKFPSRDEETQAMVKEIAYSDPNQWAVLSRTNRLLHEVERVFDEHNIPCYRLGGKSIWSRYVITIFVGVLTSLHTKDNLGIDHLFSWVGIDDADIERIHSWSKTNIVTDLSQGTEGLVISDKAMEKIMLLSSKFASWNKGFSNSNNNPFSTNCTIEAVANWMQSECTNNLQKELIQYACNMLTDSKRTGSVVQRVQAIQHAKKDTKRDGVGLVTMHSAKGLEFNNVWIMAAEEGIVPHNKSLSFLSEHSSTDEERRLFYVAMTRAREHLILSFATEKNCPSVFLYEAGLLDKNVPYNTLATG